MLDRARTLAEQADGAGRVASGRRRRSRLSSGRVDRHRVQRVRRWARSATCTASSGRCTGSSRTAAAFVFSYEHPIGLCVGREPPETPSTPISRVVRNVVLHRRARDGRAGRRAHPAARAHGERGVLRALTRGRLPGRGARRAPPTERRGPRPAHDRLARPQGRRLIGALASAASAGLDRRARAPTRRAGSYASLLVDRALVEAELEQEVERVADDGPGSTPRNAIT